MRSTREALAATRDYGLCNPVIMTDAGPTDDSSVTARTTDPAVTAVVLNWHDPSHTARCLAALRDVDYHPLKIVLIDNGCDDFAQQSFADTAITYVRSTANLGFAGGANLGIDHALRDDAEYVWFVNNDAAPQPDSLRRMIAAAQASPHPWALGPKILRTSAPERIDSIAVSIDLASGRFRLVGHDQEDRGQFDDRSAVDAVTGCAMLVRADVLRALDGFDERYFAYLEDLDLCLRIRELGGVTVVVPSAHVLHDRMASGSRRQSPTSLYYTTRNHFLLMACHGAGGITRHALRSAGILAVNLAFACRSAPRHVPSRIVSALAGTRAYLTRRFGPR